MLNKQALVGILAAVIILLGAGGAFLYSNKSKQPIQNNSTTAGKQESTTIKNNIVGLLKSGKTQKCTFLYKNSDGSSTNGTIYLTRNQMRSDITMMKNGQNSAINMIRDGDDNYIWGTSIPDNKGIKMTMSVDKLMDNQSSNSYVDVGKNIDYKCESWSINTTVFSLPTNIKFSDISEIMQETIKGNVGSTSSGSQCSICNSLTDDARKTCLEQLNCK